jgi:hypothetical protein
MFLFFKAPGGWKPRILVTPEWHGFNGFVGSCL